ncbi:hypothetical protein P43SY_008125 [Pythium insidiosum]|uniref:Uncharacterized protein n=1 Tax=Pythium insidiosum TaxID=114742 RepID=A0AAD5LIC0_PYTIN|nr:hypothetical protein P43SY_008125 [Pythium insidiosum]KAJ0402766.1 hypothetical protein ATCC90586_007677 [Pythium insidiosum]
MSAPNASPAPRKKHAFVRIKDLTPALCEKECFVKAIVMESNAKDEANASANATLLVGDDTGCVSLVLPKALALHVRVGDIVQLLQTQLVLKNGRLYLWGGRVERVGEFTMLFKESANVSTITWAPDPANPDTLVPGRPPVKRAKGAGAAK